MISFRKIFEDWRKRWEMMGGNDKATACTVAFPDVVFACCRSQAMTVLMLSFDFRRHLAHSVVMIDPTNPRIWKDAVVAAVLFALLFFVDWIASFITGY